MRVFPHAVLAACLAAGVFASAQGQGGDATKVLVATRDALGGDQKLAAVKAFVATGRTRQVRGNSLVPIEFEIACELPDKYVRRDEIPAQESGPTSTGFNAESLIQLPPPTEQPPPTANPAGARPGAAPGSAARPGTNAAAVDQAAANPPPGRPAAANPAPGRPAAVTPAAINPPGGPMAAPAGAPPDPRKARVASIKQDFVKLTLGMFATSFASYPLTFTLNGQAEAPQGKADIIEVKGPGTFALRLFVNSETHLPIMVSWTTPATNVVLVPAGQPAPEGLPPGAIKVDAPAPPPPTATPEEKARYATDILALRRKTLAGAKPVENRIYYADYRDVGNGLKFPFRLRRAVAGETLEETNFDNFKINPRIDPRKFEVVK